MREEDNLPESVDDLRKIQLLGTLYYLIHVFTLFNLLDSLEITCVRYMPS